ncbi:hypothetical protein WJU23_08620 [Prosthecobacter sp. SYSU 5D2]|uniref:hypothetical protein n=1 Tax=Prosthecobacter sp. SYSU 5D2 TaxID=3134134 RepID=UPI0031FEF9C9
MKRAFFLVSGIAALICLTHQTGHAADEMKGREVGDVLKHLTDKELIKLRSGRGEGVDEATAKLKAAEVSKDTAFVLKVGKMEEWDFPNQGNVEGWRTKGIPERLRAAGLYIETNMILYIKKEALTQEGLDIVKKHRSGNKLLLAGRVSRCIIIQTNAGQTELHIDLQVSSISEAR